MTPKRPASIMLVPLLGIAASLLLRQAAGTAVEVKDEPCKTFNFTISWEPYAPDGFSREMLLVNGQSPGPVMELEQDEWVVVQLHNQSPYNTTMHFHGIEMHNTPWSDGVPGVSQRAIAPGKCFTYRFQATECGSYWYHAHFRGHIEDGMYGPIVVHPRKGHPNPFHMISNDSASIEAMERAVRQVRPLMLTDHMHFTSEQKRHMTTGSNIEIICYESILFNGKGRVNCLPEDVLMANLDAPRRQILNLVPGEKLTPKGCLPPIVMAAFGGNKDDLNATALPADVFQVCRETMGQIEVIKAPAPGRDSWIALDIVDSANFIVGVMAIDDHDMWVYAVDGSYIEPQKVQAVVLSNGERYSVLVKPRRPGRFKIRCHAESAPQTIIGHAILDVAGPTTSTIEECAEECATSGRQYIDIIGRPLTDDVVFFDEARSHPYPPEPVAQTADAMHILNMGINGASYIWALNSTSLPPMVLDGESPPALFDPQRRIDEHDNVTIVTRNGTWVDLVFLSARFPMPPHPIHKHGVKMFRIGRGKGPFRWTSVADAMKEVPAQFNLVNPARTDGVMTPRATTEATWLVVRYHVTNPGAWLLHCHIANHMMGGMVMVILDGVDAWPAIPKEYMEY